VRSAAGLGSGSVARKVAALRTRPRMRVQLEGTATGTGP